MAALDEDAGGGCERIEHVDERREEGRHRPPDGVPRGPGRALAPGAQPGRSAIERLDPELRDGVVTVLEQEVAHAGALFRGQIGPVPDPARQVDVAGAYARRLGDGAIPPDLLAPLRRLGGADPQCSLEPQALGAEDPHALEHLLAHLGAEALPEEEDAGPLLRRHRRESLSDPGEDHACLVGAALDISQGE